MSRPLGITTLRILAAIRGGTRYGLDIVETTGLPSGTVYPALGRLKKKRLVDSRWEDQAIAESEGRPRRRYYRLTADGEAALARGAERLAALDRPTGDDPVADTP